MNDLRYIKEEEHFLNYSFDVFKKYFNDSRASFNSFYKSIGSEDKKNKLLKIASFYRFLVVEGKFIVESNKPDTYIDYLDDTYKYIAIFAFIEDLYKDEKYEDFYSWLRNRNTNMKFSINDKLELDSLHESYLSIHGSTRKVVRFFELLDDQTKQSIINAFRVRGSEGKSFAGLIKLLYQIRNNFIHNAELITQFNTGTTLHHIENKLIINNLNIESMKIFFEEGFLRFFGWTLSR